MKDNYRKVWDYIRTWYNVNNTDFEKSRVLKLLAEFEGSIPDKVIVKTEVKVIPLKSAITNGYSLSDIELIICKKHVITPSQLRKDSEASEYLPFNRKSTNYVDARNDFAIMAYNAGFSYFAISRYLGYKHHTSVLHLVRKRALAV